MDSLLPAGVQRGQLLREDRVGNLPWALADRPRGGTNCFASIEKSEELVFLLVSVLLARHGRHLPKVLRRLLKSTRWLTGVRRVTPYLARSQEMLGKIVRVIRDADIVADLEKAGRRHVWPGHSNDLDYTLQDVRCADGVLDFEIAQRDGSTVRLRVDLPSTGRPQPWLYGVPTDRGNWTQQLLVWLDEEVFTSGLGPGRARESALGVSYVVAESYGFRRADAAEHARLTLAAGPLGWYGIPPESR